MNIHHTAKNACLLGLASAVFTLPLVAEAHHVMDGQAPGNAVEGFLSGLAHPIIGVDHFLFVLALGVAGYYFGRRTAAISAYLLAAITGTLIFVVKLEIPLAEQWVSLTILLIGLTILIGGQIGASRWTLLGFGVAGILHGYLYGEGIVGAEQAPLYAYLSGFTVIQWLIAYGGFWAARRWSSTASEQSALRRRLFGGVVSAAGAVFFALAVIQ